MGKKKLKKVCFTTIINDMDSIKDQQLKVAKQVAEKLIDEGFVKFDFSNNKEISGIKFVDAMIYAVKLV